MRKLCIKLCISVTARKYLEVGTYIRVYIFDEWKSEEKKTSINIKLNSTEFIHAVNDILFVLL